MLGKFRQLTGTNAYTTSYTGIVVLNMNFDANNVSVARWVIPLDDNPALTLHIGVNHGFRYKSKGGQQNVWIAFASFALMEYGGLGSMCDILSSFSGTKR